MASEALLAKIADYDKYVVDKGIENIDEDVINAYAMAARVAFTSEHDSKTGIELCAKAKKLAEDVVMCRSKASIWDLEKYAFAHNTYYTMLRSYYDVLLIEAQNYQVDAAFQYLERKRQPKERFYMPRRKQFMRFGLVDAFQGLIDDRYDILCISLPPGTGKTSAEKFFHALVAGWYPNDFSLFYSHSSDITRMYYDGVADIIQNKDEYAWGDIFPGLAVTGTNAKLEQLNVGKYKPFPSVQCTSYGSKNAGKVRASKFLLVDDLVGGIEEALNKNILDKLWNAYAVDARQRKIQDTDGRPCKEIHIATRWSVHDVIGRLQRMYDGDPRVKIINVPDIDPATGESNFDYECGGFTKAFFDDQARLMDPISYQCLYKQEPVEREGLLYHADDIRTYFALPEREPDAIFGICDTKSKGIDFMFLPVVYQYGQDYYLDDCVCDDNSDFGVQEARCSDLLLRNNVQQCQFESNVGGDRFAANVAKIVEDKGGRCNITTKPTETNKETKIIVNADWVKKHVLFKDKTLYEPHSDYGQMMSQLLSYVVAGRNRNDDVPDGMAMLALYATRDTAVARNSVQAIRNPFSWGGGDYYGEY